MAIVYALLRPARPNGSASGRWSSRRDRLPSRGHIMMMALIRYWRLPAGQVGFFGGKGRCFYMHAANPEAPGTTLFLSFPKKAGVGDRPRSFPVAGAHHAMT